MKYPFTRPLIPPVEAWAPYLRPAYDRRYFTNFGPVEQAFTAGLERAFGRSGETCVLCCNATVGLMSALVALGVRGPVVTPSFTFAATLDAIYAARCEPVLCDVDADTWECSADSIRRALGGRRPAAIMPVRTFGLIRDLTPIAELAREWDVPLVIDAAAALGVDRLVQPELPCRYVEVFSLHATKAFGIGEGGAMFAPEALRERLRGAINFGLNPDRSFDYGFNGKMAEFQAAVGLSVLDVYQAMMTARRSMVEAYADHLSDRQALSWPADVAQSTCSTFPVLLPAEADLERFVSRAGELGALYRRYYFPSVAQGFRELGASVLTPVSADLSERMVCLPVYADATGAEQEELLGILSEAMLQL